MPNVFIQYWSMRVMAYTAGLVFLLLAVGTLAAAPQAARRRHAGSCGWRCWAVPLPFIINTAGWVLTENGRQPWIVQGLQLTKDGVSPSVGHRRGRGSA